VLEEHICANSYIASFLGLRLMHPAINMLPQFIVCVLLCTAFDVVVEGVKHKRCHRRLVPASAKNTIAVMCTNELLCYHISVPFWKTGNGVVPTQI
jgi:hypothetical protein